MTLSSLAIADTLSAADKRIQLTVGARLQQVSVRPTSTPSTGLETDELRPERHQSRRWRWSSSRWENVSLYGNFIQGLQQGIDRRSAVRQRRRGLAALQVDPVRGWA